VTAGRTFGIIGPLAAFPFRLAAKEGRRRGAALRRGAGRGTSHVVFGRRLLAANEARIEKRVDAARCSGGTLISENGFLRLIGLAAPPENPALTRQSLLEQSGLTAHDLDMLALFDAFEHHAEPFSFRDLILAKKYAGLIAGGAGWHAIARSIHRSPGPVASLTAVSLQVERQEAIYARRGDLLSELDGQMLLPIADAGDDEAETLFALAEDAEEEGRFEDAAVLYGRCLALDSADASAAFNQANCLVATDQPDEAKAAYLRALKVDPRFVEAWFNFAGLLKEHGDFDAARRHLATAIRLDRDYADAIYNLAALEFEAENLAEARRWWSRYLELDQTSEWAQSARRGIQYVDLSTHRSAG
jgi:tetratricopeptide (TPR) repeat protein